MEFFTEINKPLLEAAAAIDFKLKKNGVINPFYHNSYERGLFFIKRAVEIHGNKYGYGKVEYVNNSTKVILQCKEHDDFEQTPHNHLDGKGCPHCGGTAKLSKQTFLARAQEVHGNKYNYDASIYTSMHHKLEILCPEHGPFQQLPLSHIHHGAGCPACVGNRPLTTEEFIKRARDIHGDNYDYGSVQYKRSHEKVEIHCYLHGYFFQAPTDHLSFRGCPKCSGKTYNILYLLKCNDTNWYKIGITTDNVQKRLSSLGGNLKEVHHVKLEDPGKHERTLHKLYDSIRVFNAQVRSGHTEFFSLTDEQVKEVIAYMDEVSNER